MEPHTKPFPKLDLAFHNEVCENSLLPIRKLESKIPFCFHRNIIILIFLILNWISTQFKLGDKKTSIVY